MPEPGRLNGISDCSGLFVDDLGDVDAGMSEEEMKTLVVGALR